MTRTRRKEDNWEKTWTSAAQSIYALLQYTDKKESYSLVDIMGLSGHAFRINIHPSNVSPAGPTMFAPTDLLVKPLHILGLNAEELDGFPTPAPPEKLQEAIVFAQESIDRGLPVIGWSLFVPEFGIIYGYDDEKQELYCKDHENEGAISYAKLNELAMNFIYMMRIRDSFPVEPLSAWKTSMEIILEFASGKAPTLSPEFKHGLEGYDAWIQAFENRTVDPFGNAYNTEVVCCAREYATRFFQEFPQKWSNDTNIGQVLLKLGEEAAVHYENVANSLREMRDMFPFPQGGDPNNLLQAQKAIALLTEAKAAEQVGINVIQQMYDAILRSEIGPKK